MELQIAKRYPVAATVDQAWAVLADPPRLAACMPGAQLTEALDAMRHKGQVKTRIGPASLAFAGEIEWQESDAAARRIRLHAKGADKGGSAAQMQLSAHLEADAEGAGCVLVGAATVSVSGKLAQFGNRLLQPAQTPENPDAAPAPSDATPPAASPRPSAPPPPAVRELNVLALLGQMLKAWWAGLFKKP